MKKNFIFTRFYISVLCWFVDHASVLCSCLFSLVHINTKEKMRRIYTSRIFCTSHTHSNLYTHALKRHDRKINHASKHDIAHTQCVIRIHRITVAQIFCIKMPPMKNFHDFKKFTHKTKIFSFDKYFHSSNYTNECDKYKVWSCGNLMKWMYIPYYYMQHVIP